MNRRTGLRLVLPGLVCLQGSLVPGDDLPFTCNTEVDDQCPPEEICSQLAGFRVLVRGAFQSVADIDTDSDGNPPVLSVFLHFTAVGTELLDPACRADCNDNGIGDADNITGGFSQDADGNGIPDGPAMFRFLFLGSPPPPAPGPPTDGCGPDTDTDTNESPSLGGDSYTHS